MSRYAINKAADERGVEHSTALLIWECCSDRDEFIIKLDAVARGHGFTLID